MSRRRRTLHTCIEPVLAAFTFQIKHIQVSELFLRHLRAETGMELITKKAKGDVVLESAHPCN